MRVFCFATGVSSSHRRKLRSAIIDLGGARLFEEEDDDTESDGVEEMVHPCPPTHLVVDLPTRSEKFLTGVGRGCWVVVMDYISASRAAGTWLNEETYEVSPRNIIDSNRSLAEPDVASALSLVSMARYSRRLVAEVGVNLFVDWRAFLVVTGVSARDSRMEIFKNIVVAGGGVCFLVHLEHLISFIASHRDVTHVLGFGLDRVETNGASIDRTKLQDLLAWKKKLSFVLDSPYLIRRAFDTIEETYRRHINSKKSDDAKEPRTTAHKSKAVRTDGDDARSICRGSGIAIVEGTNSPGCLANDIAEGRPDETSLGSKTKDEGTSVEDELSFLRPSDPPLASSRTFPHPPDTSSRSFSGVSFDTSLSCKQQQQQQQRQQQELAPHHALATPTSITRKVALLSFADAPAGILKKRMIELKVVNETVDYAVATATATTAAAAADRRDEVIDAGGAVEGSEESPLRGPRLANVDLDSGRKGVTFAEEASEKTGESDDFLPDLDDDDGSGPFDAFLMDIDDDGGDAGLVTTVDVKVEVDPPHFDDRGSIIDDNFGGEDERYSNEEEKVDALHACDAIVNTASDTRFPAAANDADTDEITIVKRRRVRRPRQKRADDSDYDRKRPHSALEDMEMMEEPEEFSSPKKILLPWKPALKIPIPPKLMRPSTASRSRRRDQVRKLNEAPRRRPFPSGVASVFSQFSESSFGAPDLVVSSTASAASNAVSAATVTPTNTTPTTTTSISSSAASFSWKEIVNGIESLFMATTPLTFPPPSVLRGLASTLASIDVAASLTTVGAANVKENNHNSSAPRPSDLGTMPIVHFGMKYFQRLIRLYPPESAIASRDGENGPDFAPQDVYSQMLPGFAGLGGEVKTKVASRGNAEKRNGLLAWLVPKKRDVAGDDAPPSPSASSSLLWTTLEKLLLNCLVECDENSGCLPLAEIRRDILKQRRSLQFLTYVVDEVLAVNLHHFLRIEGEEATTTTSSAPRKRIHRLPILAQMFWPGQRNEPRRSAGANSQVAAPFLPLSPLLREFGRHLATCVSICARRTIEPEVDGRNLAALRVALDVAVLLAEYARYRDWMESHAVGALTHATHLGPAATSLASFFAGILTERTHDDEDDDEFLRFILRRLSVSLPWLASVVTQRVLDQRFSVRLLRDHLKPAPSQLLLYHIVSRYFYLIPRVKGEEEEEEQEEKEKDDPASCHVKIPRMDGNLASPSKRRASSSTSPLRIVGERRDLNRPDGRFRRRSPAGVRPPVAKVVRNKFGETKLHAACKKGDAESVKALLSTPDTLINAQDNNLWTPLHEACNAGHVEIVRLLLNHEPASLPAAASLGRTAVEKNPRADLNAKSLEGITPLHDAVLCGRREVVEVLLETPAGLRVLWEHEAPEARGEATHSELPFVSRFVEASMTAIKESLDSAMLRCRDDGALAASQALPPAMSTSQRLDDSQISEGSQSQNFCPSDSQYEDVFPLPATPNFENATSATTPMPGVTNTGATGATSVKNGGATVKKVLFSDAQTVPAQTLYETKRKGSSCSSTGSGGRAVTFSPAVELLSSSSSRHTMKVDDVESMVRYQLLLLTTYVDFMEQMDDENRADGVQEARGRSDSEENRNENEVFFGDARIIRRLPKHVRSLNRHIGRLIAHCRGGKVEGTEPQLSLGLREELACLDRMLGTGSDAS